MASIAQHTLGHRLLWLIDSPEVQPATMARLQIACLPDVWPDSTQAAICELVKRGLIAGDDKWTLTPIGRTQLEELGAWTYYTEATP